MIHRFLNTAELCDSKLQSSMGQELSIMARKRSSPNSVEFGVSKEIVILHSNMISSFKPWHCLLICFNCFVVQENTLSNSCKSQFAYWVDDTLIFCLNTKKKSQ